MLKKYTKFLDGLESVEKAFRGYEEKSVNKILL